MNMEFKCKLTIPSELKQEYPVNAEMEANFLDRDRQLKDILSGADNRLALIIPAIAAASTVFFFRQYLQANFQKSLVEASRIDGAGEFFTYNRIIMPIMIPAMATMGIMAVIGSWNNYLTPLMLLPDKRLHTLPLLVYALRGDIYRTEYGSIYLGLTLTALPLIIVYFALSKYIIAGVAVGGVKE